MSLLVAAAQVTCEPGDIAANLERHVAVIRQARSRGVDLLVFPELSLTGYVAEPDAALLARDPDSREIRRIALEADSLAVSFGFIERTTTGAAHNAQALVADGRVAQVHRKAYLPNYGQLREAEHFAPGRLVAPASLGGWTIAALICADLWNPALPWLAALQGSELMIVPVASAVGTVDGFDNPAGWDVVLRHCAMIYGLPIVMANHCGTKGPYRFWGGSRILDASGAELARAGTDEALLTARIDRAAIAAARARLPTMRDAEPEWVWRELQRVLTGRSP